MTWYKGTKLQKMEGNGVESSWQPRVNWEELGSWGLPWLGFVAWIFESDIKQLRWKGSLWHTLMTGLVSFRMAYGKDPISSSERMLSQFIKTEKENYEHSFHRGTNPTEKIFFMQVSLDLVVILPILLSLCLAQLKASLCQSALRGCCGQNP